MRQYNKVYLEITNRCNLRCSFCPGTKRQPRTMSPVEFGRAFGCRSASFWNSASGLSGPIFRQRR